MSTHQSTVKWFDAKKGYGFIDHPEDGNDVFVHYSQIESEQDFKTLQTGQPVEFELSDGPKGLHALSVVPLDEVSSGESTSNGSAEGQVIEVEPTPAAPGQPPPLDADQPAL